MTYETALAAPVDATTDDVRIGISACLLGHEVRMNGGHCRKPWLTEVLGAHATFVPVCPEVGMGLPVPRPVMRLVAPPSEQADRTPRMVVTDTGEDLTDQIESWSAAKLDELARADLHGFVLKKDSPSCGVFRVKVYDHNGSPSDRGSGRFAAALVRRFPHLPVEEEGRLNDRDLRENFLVRVWASARWRRYLRDDGGAAGLMRFHAQHKYALLATAPGVHQELGRLVGSAGRDELAEVQTTYEARLMEALANRSTRGRHVNVMQHLLGFVKEHLTGADKENLERQLRLYRNGSVPRSVPIALVRHLLLSHDAPPWAREQVYLQPFDETLHVNEAL